MFPAHLQQALGKSDIMMFWLLIAIRNTRAACLADLFLQQLKSPTVPLSLKESKADISDPLPAVRKLEPGGSLMALPIPDSHKLCVVK